MNRDDSAMELVRKDIIHYINNSKKPTQDDIIRAVNWPSILVSFALGVLLEDGTLETKVTDTGRLFRPKGVKSIFESEIPETAS